ncbi:MAG: winged helix-turn-helix transcriptional regulator [Chitinispirillaceae bacterium]|nr:winged helix-turn-helix transcriptional regulator [Chitinispirillaceae bacterium]
MKNEAGIFKALGEEARLRIMALLVHGELRVQDLVDITGLPQPSPMFAPSGTLSTSSRL